MRLRNIGTLESYLQEVGALSALTDLSPASLSSLQLLWGDNAAPGPLAHAPFHGVEWDVAQKRSFFVVELLLQPLVELTTLQPVRAADQTMWR